MTPPVVANQHCPPEIRAHPLPGDRCADETQPYIPPERRFRQLSVTVDLPGFSIRSGSAGGVDFRFRSGLGAIFRPHPNFSLGVQFDTDYTSEFTALGRALASFNLQRFGMFRLSFGAFAGLRQLFSQGHGFGATDVPVSGSLFAFGAEANFHIQLLHEFSLFPFCRLLVSPGMDVRRDSDGRSVSLPWSYELQFGIGWSLDLVPSGN
jgi:hypothetical protein